jgi:cell division protein FtsL
MIRLSSLLWLGAAGLAATVLFQVKDEVQDLEGELVGVQREIQRDREAIHVLKAEWSYLNRPARIEELARRHLGFQPLEQTQISLVDYLPARPEDFGRNAEAERLIVPPRRPSMPAGLSLAATPEAPPQPKIKQKAKPASQTVTAKASAPKKALATAPSAVPVNPVTGRPLPVSSTLVSTGAQ